MRAVAIGALTIVDGIRVGHVHRCRGLWRTGTTVVLSTQGATAGVSVRGGGPGTRETDALRPENLVDAVHAVCLTGGSAYGLAAADGVAAWLEEQQLGVPVGPPGDSRPSWVVPVVPAAVIFDLGRGGAFGNRPTAEFGYRAVKSAHGGAVERGSVGAGTGAVAGGLQGGVGTAGTTIACDGIDITVGALAVVNSAGSVIDPGSGLPYEHDHLRRPTRNERLAVRAVLTEAATPPPLNTTIGVVATSARLSKPEVTKLADIAHDGLARAVRPAHSLFDGDTVFGLATGQRDLVAATGAFRDPRSRAGVLHQIFDAAARCFALACTDAVVAAVARGGPPAYRDLCPSVWSTARGRRRPAG
jgi:L-aminopeptidase/D-esterase-like protein